MYKVTIFERYTQLYTTTGAGCAGCYDVQSYNFWKIYTTALFSLCVSSWLLWCTKLQFLKDIHNEYRPIILPQAVVMMYKVTIFERYTQRVHRTCCTKLCCYDVQSYNFWKIYTTQHVLVQIIKRLLWCTKLQFLKDIHNK